VKITCREGKKRNSYEREERRGSAEGRREGKKEEEEEEKEKRKKKSRKYKQLIIMHSITSRSSCVRRRIPRYRSCGSV
jgi:hypothetical protein